MSHCSGELDCPECKATILNAIDTIIMNYGIIAPECLLNALAAYVLEVKEEAR